jgi:hypothetical protein
VAENNFYTTPNGSIVSVPKKAQAQYSLLLIYGGTPPYGGDWMKTQVPAALYERYVIVLPKYYYTSFNEVTKQYTQLLDQKNIKISEKSLLGFSGGGLRVQENFSAGNWKIIGLIDPSTRAVYLNLSFSDKVKMIYNRNVWSCYPSIQAVLPKLAQKVSNAGGYAEENTKLKHLEIPNYFLNKILVKNYEPVIQTKTPLLPIEIISIYKDSSNKQILLPKNLAKCTPDTRNALLSIDNELMQHGGKLVLSDLFRSYAVQYQAYMDYVNKKKTAYSPPPGGSMHEAGRAFDLDLSQIKVTLKDFWAIAQKYGVSPIISQPLSTKNEAWHFDCRGSHNKVYEYYSSGKGNNMKPYTAMAVSAILATGIQVDKFKGMLEEAAIQCGLIRLGFEIGNIDGLIGKNTKAALSIAGVALNTPEIMLGDVEALLLKAFLGEFGS